MISVTARIGYRASLPLASRFVTSSNSEFRMAISTVELVELEALYWRP